MTAQRINNRLAFTTAAAVAALFLAGCGTGTPQSQTSSTPAASPADSASQPAASGAAAGPAASTPASAAPAPAGPALCKAAGLTATTDSTGGGAAGSVYMQLLLTNTGSEPCFLSGFAGVSLTAGADGAPIGAAAARDTTPATEVLLEPGQAGAATLRYTQAANYPDCSLTPAAGFRIYPPEDTASLFLAQPRDACANAGINLLTIGAFQAQ
ncbi:hypothetical protein NicSoilB4_04820 [Arthrobacter sp. NicSoilB4]|uniref:DUF4232 domain-containing protein n=1 Tax=Arthrobacter sp. NicSoilB4 TaxID=2830997 RepID=UPI001CC35162|nr:DUF4232 domain-containing protein [Arthrobacter sp. NicSoilB4]BCW65719.1 hypothetical protein NicSoilB4_04820 [Arthrobacter sp. NicSoilB4]